MNEKPATLHLPEAIDIAEARTLVLRQIDSLADWLFVQCKGSTQIKARPALHGRTAEDFKDWPVAWLVSLTMDLGQPQATRCAASDAIGERFLADDDTQAEVIRVATRLMYDRWAAERLDGEHRALRAELARDQDVLEGSAA